VTHRTYNQVTGTDRSDLLGQVVAQRQRVTERLAGVGRVIAVMSGKGGVGKTFVTTRVATALVPECPGGVGVLDADLKSPTAARMLGATGPVRTTETGVEPAIGRSGVKVFSMDLLLDDGKPLAWREPKGERFIWRGTLETGALREFLSDVSWGSLDILLIDLPPGGDRLSDLAELVPGLAGTLVVTIPTEESYRSVERSIQGALDGGIRVLGVVENMAGYECGECGKPGPLFPGTAGDDLARKFNIPLLGRIPFSASASLSLIAKALRRAIP
jgi:ATP-binding protein involved in chromosome partitioning